MTLTSEMPKKRYWVSDLHLFTRRSQAEEFQPAIRAAALGAEMFVLGGDIFDFKWSTHKTTDEAVEEAVRWLQMLIECAPDCRFHFLLGNHDCHEPFVERLAALADESPNLSWHPHFLRVSDTVFLHGDVVDRPMGPHEFTRRRERHSRAERQGEWLHALYDVVVFAGLHKTLCTVLHRDPSVTSRLLGYLEEVGHGAQTGLKHVYFGHTHVPMSHHDFGGVKFHNGGAPLKGMRFQILEPIVGES